MADVYKKNRIGKTLVDFRNTINHPMLLKYSEIYDEALINAPIIKGRVAPNFILAKNSPFYLAAQKGILNTSSLKENIFNSLNDFYKKFQPKSIADWFQLNTDSDQLLKNEAWASVLPWRARTLKNYKEVIEAGTYKDNLSNKLDMNIYESGWAYCGPVDKKKCDIETTRIFNLINSIRNNGYLRHNDKDGDIIATVLVNEKGEWVWLITNGYHRAAVIAALGNKTVPIRINLVIRRDEADFWPQVITGTYTKEEALKIFDNIFN